MRKNVNSMWHKDASMLARYAEVGFDPSINLGSSFDANELNDLSALFLSANSQTGYKIKSHNNSLADKEGMLDLSLEYQDLERKRISRELHDGLGQLLTNIRMRLQLYISETQKSSNQIIPDSSLEILTSIPEMVNEAIGEMRSICMDLHPTILEDLGLLAAISCKSRQCREVQPGLVTETDFQVQEKEIPDELKTSFYRVAQEALNNAVKHSQADRIRVSIKKSSRFIYLVVSDNGCGFDPNKFLRDSTGLTGRHNGLRNMQKRAEALGGGISFISRHNQGTDIELKLPFMA